MCLYFYFFLSHLYFASCGQAEVSGVVPSPPRYVPSVFIAHRVQHSHCSSIFIELTHALLALSASQFVHNKKNLRSNTSVHSRGLELTQLTYSRHEDDLLYTTGVTDHAGINTRY